MRIYDGKNSDKLLIYVEPNGAIGFEVMSSAGCRGVSLGREDVKKLMDDLERFERFDKLEQRIKGTM